MDEILEQAAQAISDADVLFITAGAGMGVDSGLPDFRGNEGFWKAYPLLKEEQLSFMDLANPAWFKDDPKRAWGFYGHRYNLYKKTIPHLGFSILQDWCAKKESHFVFTSNVDGHFQKSGFSPDYIQECHGSINHLQCQNECTSNICEATSLDLSIDEGRLIATSELPTCPYCGEISRPNILMFGDSRWIHHRSSKQYENFENWKHKYHHSKIVSIEMGAGKAIPTVRRTSDAMPGKTIRINPREPHGGHDTISIPTGALESLTEINNLL